MPKTHERDLRVVATSRMRDGGCNACTRTEPKDYSVTVISARGSSLRFCLECTNLLRAQLKQRGRDELLNVLYMIGDEIDTAGKGHRKRIRELIADVLGDEIDILTKRAASAFQNLDQ